MRYIALPAVFILKTSLALIFLVFVLASCGSIKPPAPDLPVSQIKSVPLPESEIDVPVVINLEQVLNDFNSKIPAEFSGEGNAGLGQYRWHILRQPFSVSLSGDSIAVTDDARFNGGGYIKNPFTGQWNNIVSCKADLNIGINASLDLSNSYGLKGDAHLTKFSMQGCDLQVAGYNFTSLLKPRAVDAINNALSGLNKQIRQYNFRSILQPTWAVLNQPVKIADLGYIVINPSAVRIGDLSGSGKQLSLTAGITANPVFYLANPPKNNINPLPDFSTGKGHNGFNLNVDLNLDYKPLNQLLNNTIDNQKIEAGENAYIIIKDAEVYGTGNEHLLIKVNFSAKKESIPYHGVLYFTCTPYYDVNTGELYANDINFDVSTINRLKEGPAVWLLSAALKKYLKGQVHFNISGQVNGLKDKLNKSINQRVNPNVTLAGSVNALSLQGILPLNDYMVLRVIANGNLSVKIN